MTAGGVVVADQRQRPLRHALRDGVGKEANFLRNAHARNGGIGIARGHVVERAVGDGGHHGHHKAGQADAQNLGGDVLLDRKRFEAWRNDCVFANAAEKAEKVPRGDQVGQHSGNGRALNVQPKGKNITF